MRLYLKAWSAWAPGVESPEAWRAWAGAGWRLPDGGLAQAALAGGGLSLATGAPALGHLDAMFKRRLSQLSRMILHVGHELAPGRELPTVFASHYGEISQQYKISQTLIEEDEVKPAAFSLSVFNTPVALLSIAEKNHCRGSALYGGAASLVVALAEAAAMVAAGDGELLLLAGDEALPPAWQALSPQVVPPHALGLLLAAQPSAGALGIELGQLEPGQAAQSPTSGLPDSLAFLAWLLADGAGQAGKSALALAQGEFGFRLELLG